MYTRVDDDDILRVGDDLVPLPAEQSLSLGVHEDAAPLGIGGDDDAVVAQVVEGVLNVEGVLEEVEFLVFVHHFFG